MFTNRIQWTLYILYYFFYPIWIIPRVWRFVIILKPRLFAAKRRWEVVVELDDYSVIVFENCLVSGFNQRKWDLVLTRTQMTIGLFIYAALYLRTEEWTKSWRLLFKQAEFLAIKTLGGVHMRQCEKFLIFLVIILSLWNKQTKLINCEDNSIRF